VAVNTEITSHSYSPGSAMAAEAIPFPFLQAADLLVTHVAAADGARTLLTLNTNYTIGGDGAAQSGTVTASAAWPAGDVWLIERVTELKQKAVIAAGQPLPAADLTRTLDKAMMGAQENRRDIADTQARALMVAPGQALDPIDLEDFKGKFLAVDAGGGITPASGTGADGALRTDLAASGGSALAGFLPRGTGAVARSVQDELREIISAAQFGYGKKCEYACSEHCRTDQGDRHAANADRRRAPYSLYDQQPGRADRLRSYGRAAAYHVRRRAIFDGSAEGCG
jgi:hypothetical protein